MSRAAGSYTRLPGATWYDAVQRRILPHMPELPVFPPHLFESGAMRAALARRDVTTIYRILTEHGVSQHRIAVAVRCNASEVSEIIRGRKVLAYDVFVRICEGFGIPRGWMGLGYDENSGDFQDDGVEVDEDMKRRALMAAGSIALLGAPVLGEVLHIPVRPDVPTPLPSRLGSADVNALRNLTATLRTTARTYGGGADVLTGVAHRSLPLMSVPASEATRAALGSALAELHTLAGWCCVDSGLHDQARAHFAKAMDLAGAAGDNNEMASAFQHAGIQMIDSGAFDDGLKAYQLGLTACDPNSDTATWLTAESALPLAAMGHTDAAKAAIKTAREHPLVDPFDSADMDFLTACIYRRLGQLDTAESFAASSVRKWRDEGRSARDSAEAIMALAELHVATGESDAASLANQSINTVATLRSTRARMRLGRLAATLDTRRPGSDFRDLAHRARRVAFLAAT
jgi:transcriptional regulator with XRE-family HTH domain/tetratricopeptide (TPR) repeat protein